MTSGIEGRRTLRSWSAFGAAAAAAMVFAGTASAATLAQAGCTEPLPGTYNIGLSGSGFAPNTVVTLTWMPASGLPLPVLTTTFTTDGSGNFPPTVITVVMDTPGSPGSAFPVSYTATDLAGNSASLTVTGCGGGGGGGGQPVTKDDCKKGGFAGFSDPAFKNQGQCVSSVASKNK